MGLIVGVTVNGKEIEPGTKTPLSAKVVLLVGEAPVMNDSIGQSDEAESIDESLI